MPAIGTSKTKPIDARSRTGDCLISAILEEFAEMPGMRLTRAQFRRVWHLTPAESERLISNLIAIGFLSEDPHGRIGRASQAH
jgi:hypothetical protein